MKGAKLIWTVAVVAVFSTVITSHTHASRITDHPADDFAPVWSPDSRHLAFKSNRLGSVSLWTVELKDGVTAGQPMKLKDDAEDRADA
jgi:Tol biopolymer transport system component